MIVLFHLAQLLGGPEWPILSSTVQKKASRGSTDLTQVGSIILKWAGPFFLLTNRTILKLECGAWVSPGLSLTHLSYQIKLVQE